MSQTIASLIVLGLSLAGPLSSCAQRAELENRPCPCASGWTCCAAANVCAAEPSLCPGARDSGADGAATHDARSDSTATCAGLPLDTFIAGAALVFRGTIVRANAATPGLPITDFTSAAVVRVERELYTLGTPLNVPLEVTILLKEAVVPSLVGKTGVFFATGWLAGQTLAFRATEAFFWNVSNPCVEEAVVTRARYRQDVALYDLLRKARCVAIAQVTADADKTCGPISEHNPQWHEASISVLETLAGACCPTLRYAASIDVQWTDAPKLVAGQRAIFIAAKDNETCVGGDGCLVTDHRQVQSLSERTRIVNLLLNPPPGP